METGTRFRDYQSSIIYLASLHYGLLDPDIEIDSIADLTLEKLDKEGTEREHRRKPKKRIQALAFDIDNTLCGYRGTSIDERIRPQFEVLRGRFGDRMCIISNTDQRRRAQLEEYFGMHVVQSAVRKPRAEPFLEALEYLRTSAEETAMIGDRLLTDIAGANRAGFYSIKVRPLHPRSEPLNIRIARFLENAVLRFYTN